MTGDYTYDGVPLQAGLRLSATSLTGQYPGYSILGQREMVIIERKFVDDPENLSKAAVEYVCRDLQTGEAVHGVRRLVVNGGVDDGDDAPLRPATQLRPGAKVQLTPHTPAIDTDGDRVLVGFIEGSRHRAVILGVLTHNDAGYGATKADGERRLTVHKGTSVETKQDGKYVIKRGDTSITLNADQTIEVKHKSGSKLRFEDDGTVSIEAIAVKLGAAALVPPLDGVVHGSGVDSFTGATYAALGNASVVVLAKK